MRDVEDFYRERAAREDAYLAMHAAYIDAADLAMAAGKTDLAAQYLEAATATRRELQKMERARLNALRN